MVASDVSDVPNSRNQFLGGLSLLNHLIASRMANYEWPFGTLPFGLFRWFKFTKPPYSITHGELRLAIWDTSFWTFWLKFGHKGP